MRQAMNVLVRSLGAVLLSALVAPVGEALEPPSRDEMARYHRDGSLPRRLKAARELGNHQVKPELVAQATYRLRVRQWEKGAIGDPPTPPPAWKGMPTRGNVKVFALLIAFSDYAPTNAASAIDAGLYGDGDPARVPYESVRNYYRRASYGQLEIGGSTLGWYTTAYPRSSVPETALGRQALIKEALSSIDASGHDFSQYDNDGDGAIDYFVVIWTGPDSGWGNFWWGYQTSFGDGSYLLDGKRLRDYSWQWEARPATGAFSPLVVIHETGHALGLPDYYDYDPATGPGGGVGRLDMMDGNWGDHNCFSKFLLDWLTPEVVSGGLNALSLRSAGSFGDAVVFSKGATGDPFAEYFMVQNRTRTGNDTGYPADGLLIWHVDARLDSGGRDYLLDNSWTEHKLLRLMEADGLEEIEAPGQANVGDYFGAGETFGPGTNPSIARYDSGPNPMSVNSISAPGSPMTLRIDEIVDGTGPTGAPTTPTDEGVTKASEDLVFSWTRGTAVDPETGIVAYQLQVGTTTGGNDTFDRWVGGALGWTVSGGMDGATHYARVRAMNGAGLVTAWSGDSDGIMVDLPVFPCAALDNCSLVFKTSGAATWFEEGSVVYSGATAAQAGDVGDKQFTNLQTTLTGPGTLRYWWKVSSEQNFDFLRFFVDGASAGAPISGEQDWKQQIVVIPAGRHVVQWRYTKDVNVSAGSDTGWVDRVEWEVATPVPAEERSALIALWNATEGTGWTRKTGWRNATDTDFAPPGTECSWYGVSCAGSPTRVTALRLASNGLRGLLPDLSALSELQILDFGSNSGLTADAIPAWLSARTGLRELNLYYTNRNGALPDLSGATGLEILNLGYNPNLTAGPIPSWVSTSASLRSLNLYYTNRSGAIPDLSGLTGLEILDLGYNFGLSAGPIPDWVASLANLYELDLTQTNRTGPIPSTLGALSQLTYLSLSGNQLTGSIPAELRALNLWWVFLSNNLLTGPLPQLDNVRAYIFVGGNSFDPGPVPAWLEGMGLYGLELTNTNRTGTVPAWLGSMTNLQYLRLGGNQLGGPAPGELAGLTGLYSTGLDLRWNALYTADAALRSFVNGKTNGGDFEATQTVAPAGVAVGGATATSLTVSWNPIRYTTEGGGYRVYRSTVSGGPYSLAATVAGKGSASATITGLSPQTEYFFVVEAFTEPHYLNRNTVVSERSNVASGTTSVDCPATPTVTTNGPVCAGGTITLSTPAVSGATYAWTGPNGFTSSLQNPSIANATAANAGTYSVTVTVSGCTSSAGTAAVVVNAKPATPTVATNSPVSAGSTIMLSTPAVSGATYAWTGPNGFTSSLRTPSVANATAANGGIYTVTVTVNGCVSAQGSATVVVNEIVTATLTVQRAGAGAGTVSSNPGGISCGSTCSASFTAGSLVTLTASPAAGSRFAGWAGGGCAGTGTCTVTMNAAKTVSATFLPTTSNRFYSITPCRVVDTRNPAGPLGGPALAAAATRTFALGGACNVPADATAVSLNVTVADATAPGSLTIYPGTGPAPGTNTITFVPGKNRANNVTMGLIGGALSVVDYQATGTVNLIIDVNGYYR